MGKRLTDTGSEKERQTGKESERDKQTELERYRERWGERQTDREEETLKPHNSKLCHKQCGMSTLYWCSPVIIKYSHHFLSSKFTGLQFTPDS